DAYELPNGPGHGYLKADQSTLLRFRAAYVSGPYRRSAAGSGRSQALVQGKIVPYGTAFVPVQEQPVEEIAVVEEPGEVGKLTPSSPVMAEKIRGSAPPAHKVWLPPLADPPGLNDLLGELIVDQRRGLVASGWPGVGRLMVPIGIVDKPFEQ